MPLPLENYLDELDQPEKPLITSKLADLSDLTPDELDLFRQAWAKIAPERRRQIIHRLVDLAEDNFELNFDEIFRVCLFDEDAEVRTSAIDSLWECEDRTLIEPLVHLLRWDGDERVRAAAATALGRFALLAECGKIRELDVARVDSTLLAAIDDETELFEVKRRAMEAISFRSLPRVREIILQAYRSGDPRLRVSAIFAMGRNCDLMWLPELLKELDSADPEMRYEAVKACGELGDERAVPRLIELVADPDTEVELAAIGALGQLGGSAAKEKLQDCMGSLDEVIRQAAEEALEELEFEEGPLSFGLSP